MLNRRHPMVAVVLALALLAAACGSSDDEAGTDATTTTVGDTPTTTVGDTEPPTSDTQPGAETTTTAGEATGEPIKIGITYVDTEALAAAGLEFDLGEHATVYQALFDDINAKGGIHGRPIEATLVPVDPTGTEGPEAACIQLAEDEDVFLISGFWRVDDVLCPVSTQNTPVVGGEMTTARLEQAGAPWIAVSADEDLPATTVRTLHERGELDGTVAVYSAIADQGLLEETVIPVLDELGVEVVETGINDAPAGDDIANESNVDLIGERFEAAGADTVLLVGPASENYLRYMIDNTTYRPSLLFTAQSAALAYVASEATTDTSILEGSLAAGTFGPAQAKFDDPTMQECVGIVEASGYDVIPPDDTSGEQSDRPFESVFQACPDVYLIRAWLEAAGPDLTNESLQAALDAGFEVTLPGDPEPRTYGPAPDADGDPAAYLFAWDEALGDFVLAE